MAHTAVLSEQTVPGVVVAASPVSGALADETWDLCDPSGAGAESATADVPLAVPSSTLLSRARSLLRPKTPRPGPIAPNPSNGVQPEA
eukprot:9619799-Lingulodinium_polyedra.AAC.1